MKLTKIVLHNTGGKEFDITNIEWYSHQMIAFQDNEGERQMGLMALCSGHTKKDGIINADDLSAAPCLHINNKIVHKIPEELVSEFLGQYFGQGDKGNAKA